MFGVSAYTKVEIETSVNSASPHKLVIMLYEAVIKEMDQMKLAIVRKDYDAKSKHVDKALRIISDGLRSSLDMTKGGEIAEQLFDLYTFLNREILNASVANSTEKVDICKEILVQLRDAWLDLSKVPL